MVAEAPERAPYADHRLRHLSVAVADEGPDRQRSRPTSGDDRPPRRAGADAGPAGRTPAPPSSTPPAPSSPSAGYEGATVRVIADRAGVDPAMVNHWFGGKEALFTAALDLPLDPKVLLAELLPGDPDGLGERIVSRFLTIWDHTGAARSPHWCAASRATRIAARMMRAVRRACLVGRVVAAVAPDQAELRVGTLRSQLVGLGMVRYVLELEPLASADHATVVAAIAPTLQRYLTGPLA